MNSPRDFVGMMRVTHEPYTEEIMTRYLQSVAKTIEEHSNKCLHCGTELKPWEPAIFANGVEVGREMTNHKWCPGCCNVLYNRLLAYMNIPEEFWA